MEKHQKIKAAIGIISIILTCILFYMSLEEKIYCGTVTNKINALQYNKHNATPDPIMIVKFDLGGQKRELHVSWITFTENEVGDRVCFERRKADMEEGSFLLGDLSALILTIGLVGGIVLILWGCGAFNPDNNDWA